MAQTKSSANSTQHTTAEMREWYEKHKKEI